MVSFPGRSGRRRRVLNEEVLSASSSHLALRAASDQVAANTSRYSEAADVENHPRITDFVPRRIRTIAVLVLGGMAVSALAVAAQQYAWQFVAAANGVVFEPWSAAPGGIVTWLSAVLLLITGVTCAIVHSIRRHRIDDINGRYRVWRWAALFAFLASANSVAGFHILLASGLTHFAGWTALREGAVWWLAVACLPLAWIFIRVLIDVKVSRFVALLLVLATGTFVAAIVSFLGFLPAAEATWEPLVTCAARLVGEWLLLATVVAYARHVVLDAQGLITVRQTEKAKKPSRRSRDAEESSLTKTSGGATKAEHARAAPTPTLQVHDPNSSRDRTSATIVPAKGQANMKDWVDGRRRERDRYQADEDDEDSDEMIDGERKLSKTERKQLRKLKARNRAA